MIALRCASGRTLAGGRRLRGIIRLTLRRMFEATVRNCSHELVLEKEVAETGRVNADVAALLVASGLASCETAFSCGGVAVGGRLRWLDLLIRVIDEILLVRHDD